LKRDLKIAKKAIKSLKGCLTLDEQRPQSEHGLMLESWSKMQRNLLQYNEYGVEAVKPNKAKNGQDIIRIGLLCCLLPPG